MMATRIIFLSFILFSFIVSISTQSSTILSIYSSELTLNSGRYARDGATGVNYYYETVEVRVNTTGVYTFISSSSIGNTYGYLYQGSFYPSYPSYNIVARDDDSAGSGQFQITATLRSDLTYILVFTTYDEQEIGSFSIVASGPDNVFNPIEILQTTTPATSSNCLDSNLITFENASMSSQIPNGYYGLNWTNVYSLDTQIYPQWSESGFYSAVTSGTWVAFNMQGESMTIHVDPPNTFSIKSFVASSAWEDSATLSMVSQRGSTYYQEASFKIEKNRPTTIELNWVDINTITFYASSNNSRFGQVFVIDNLCLDSTMNLISTEAINSCSLNEVLYENHCYYLDGIGGQCPNGYSLGSDTVLSRIADSFIGLDYKTAISDNCCVVTSETYSNYGMSGFDQCNKQGPFVAVPSLNGGGCRNYTSRSSRQLTFCVSN